MRETRGARLRLPFCLMALAVMIADLTWTADPQGLTRFDREQGRMMLRVVKNSLTSYYYDPGYKGLPLEEIFAKTDEAITRATSHAEIFSAIAGTLRSFDDSHTFFVPPGWAAKIEYSWTIQMIGQKCYLKAIQPGSEAESLGLKKGDLVLSIDGQQPSRENLWDMIYDQRILAPRASTLLVVKSPGGPEREAIVRAKVQQQKRVWTKGTDLADLIRSIKDQAHFDRHRYYESGDDLMIWKMPQFDMTREEVGRMIARTRKHQGLILDLRGNPGGAVETLEFMVGGFLGEKVRIGDVKSRLKVDPVVSRKSPEVFEGTLVVLVDSDSGSAAEIFARQMQLSGRAKVLGDRSSGSVMMSRFYDGKVGMGTTMFFGSSITVADIIMTDGKSLEKSGVSPDEVILPTGEDLVNDRDPVLTRAAALCGVNLDPVKAGSLFPIEWKR